MGYKEQLITSIALERLRLGDTMQDARSYAARCRNRFNTEHTRLHLAELRKMEPPADGSPAGAPGAMGIPRA